MPLSLKEQMDIIEARVGPEAATGGDPDLSFMDLIHIASYNEALNYRETRKDTTGNQDATLYVQKMDNITSNIVTNNNQVRAPILYMLISIGAPNTDIATVLALDITGWENFVANNMLETLERVSDVTNAEKLAYDAI